MNMLKCVTIDDEPLARECIVNYPAHPFAEKCYYEFESETVLSYSGSSGTHVPKDVRDDLKELKKLIESKGQPKKGNKKD